MRELAARGSSSRRPRVARRRPAFFIVWSRGLRSEAARPQRRKGTCRLPQRCSRPDWHVSRDQQYLRVPRTRISPDRATPLRSHSGGDLFDQVRGARSTYDPFDGGLDGAIPTYGYSPPILGVDLLKRHPFLDGFGRSGRLGGHQRLKESRRFIFGSWRRVVGPPRTGTSSHRHAGQSNGNHRDGAV
jgi:hypothetical protein